MKQTKLMSFIESLINILVGLGVAMAANAIILPLLGFPISLSQNVIIAAFMTVVSIARSFALRRLFEALHIRRPLSPFMQAVIAERFRQIEVEGWTHDHDDAHPAGELADAGASYAVTAEQWIDAGSTRPLAAPPCWPWRRDWWKPQNFRRDLVKGCALIIAEGEKWDRSRKRKRVVTVTTSKPAQRQPELNQSGAA